MEKYDVIVCGGGIAGISAALASARSGQKVCLIERNALLGGLATVGLIHWYEPLCDGKNHQMIYSIAEELLKLSIAHGYDTLDHSWFDPNCKEHQKRFSTWFDPNLFALSLTRLLDEEGVKIYFESQISEVHVRNHKMTSLDIYTIEGKIKLSAKSFIDATGSAYIFKQAHIPTRNGENYLTYATTTYKNGLGRPIFQYTGASMYGNDCPDGVRNFKDASQKDVNDYLLIGQKLCLKEYEEGKISDLSILPNMVQFRRISTIQGDYQLSKDDLYQHHEDSIGVIGVFDRPGEWYELPLGILTQTTITNLFAAGRIVSCFDNSAWEATRVIPVCALTGEVSGYLASYYNKNHRIDLKEIQNILVQHGVKLHY